MQENTLSNGEKKITSEETLLSKQSINTAETQGKKVRKKP